MTSEPEKLLPCPFCGNTRPTWVGCAEGDYVECGSCLAVMPPHDDDVPDETARWNTRHPASPSTPIPVTAEAGEREAERFRKAVSSLVTAGGLFEQVSGRYGVTWNGEPLEESYPTRSVAMDRIKQLRADAIVAALSTPATLDNTAVEGLRASVRGIRSNFERIAAHDPNDQPHYRDGVRPWGTGDLQHCIDTLLAVEATLTAKTEKAE